MNPTNTNNGSWQATARRGWCNGGFRQAMETVFGTSIFKQFQCITGQSNGSSSGNENIISLDWFALFAEKEVFGTRTMSTNNKASSLTQITWYQTTSNRMKTPGGSGTSDHWWERSPYYEYSSNFGRVTYNGTAAANYASNSCYLSPFGCM